MPNWCNNTTTVSGPLTDLTAFLDAVKNKNHDEDEGSWDSPQAEIFASLVPLPENGTKKHETGGSVFTKEDADAGTIDGYKWALENWGTKWGDCHTTYELFMDDDYIEHGTQHIMFNYETAWGPANFIKIAEMYPTLTFVSTYEESGMGFLGSWAWTNGKEVADLEMSHEDPLYPDPPDLTDADDHGDWMDQIRSVLDQLESKAEEAVTAEWVNV